MKKLTAIVLALVMALSLAACGTTNAPETTGAPETTNAVSFFILLSPFTKVLKFYG